MDIPVELLGPYAPKPTEFTSKASGVEKRRNTRANFTALYKKPNYKSLADPDARRQDRHQQFEQQRKERRSQIWNQGRQPLITELANGINKLLFEESGEISSLNETSENSTTKSSTDSTMGARMEMSNSSSVKSNDGSTINSHNGSSMRSNDGNSMEITVDKNSSNSSNNKSVNKTGDVKRTNGRNNVTSSKEKENKPEVQNGKALAISDSRKEQLQKWKKQKEALSKPAKQPFKVGVGPPAAAPPPVAATRSETRLLRSANTSTTSSTSSLPGKLKSQPEKAPVKQAPPSKVASGRQPPPPVKAPVKPVTKVTSARQPPPSKAPLKAPPATKAPAKQPLKAGIAPQPVVPGNKLVKTTSATRLLKSANGTTNGNPAGVSVSSKSNAQSEKQSSAPPKPKTPATPLVIRKKPPKPKAIDDAYIELNGKFSDVCRKLAGLRMEWVKIREDEKETIPSDIIDDIDSALGKVNLLLGSKLPQFCELLYKYLCKDVDAEKILAEDLRGWWDVAFIQIESVYNIYEELNELKNKNWVKPKPPTPPPKPRLSMGSPLRKAKTPVKANLGLRALIASRRQQLKSKPSETQEDIVIYSSPARLSQGDDDVF